MKLANEFFKRIDLIGPSISLEDTNGTRFKSNQGAFISMILYSFIVAVTFIFGEDLWQKKKPLLSLSKIQTTDSQFSLYRLPIIFSLYTYDMFNVQNAEDYVDFRIDEIVGPYTFNNSELYINKNKYSLFKCNISNEYDFYSFSDLGEFSMLCPNFNESTVLKNEYASSNSIVYEFSFSKCNKKLRSCAEDVDELFDKLILFFTFVDTLVDPANFTTPISFYESNKPIYLSSSLQKRYVLNLEKDEIVTDRGWIFEDQLMLNNVKISNFDVEYSIMLPDSEMVNITVTINSNRQITRMGRSYLKIQELFAKIGGIANALLIMFSIIFNSYLRFKYLEHLLQISSKHFDEINSCKSVINPNNNSSNIFRTPIKINTEVGPKSDVKIYQYPEISIINNNQSQNESPLSSNKFKLLLISHHALANDYIRSGNRSYLDYLFSILACKKNKTQMYKKLKEMAKGLISIETYMSCVFYIAKKRESDC